MSLYKNKILLYNILYIFYLIYLIEAQRFKWRFARIVSNDIKILCISKSLFSSNKTLNQIILYGGCVQDKSIEFYEFNVTRQYITSLIDEFQPTEPLNVYKLNVHNQLKFKIRKQLDRFHIFQIIKTIGNSNFINALQGHVRDCKLYKCKSFEKNPYNNETLDASDSENEDDLDVLFEKSVQVQDLDDITGSFNTLQVSQVSIYHIIIFKLI